MHVIRAKASSPRWGIAGTAVLMVTILSAWGIACTSATPSASDKQTRSVDMGVKESAAGYNVALHAADFVEEIDNPYFPMQPGTKWVLEGQTEAGSEVEHIRVLERTKEVTGITATVVLDVVRVNGELHEKTWDWYAQDRQGAVWYLGEDTAEYENGRKVSTKGAWEAGVDGAKPGIVMPPDPNVTESFRQEYYQDEAEDMFWVVQTGVTKDVPRGTFDRVIRTLEWTPLEPNVIVEKHYAPGVGLIAEEALSGGKELFELVEMKGG